MYGRRLNMNQTKLTVRIARDVIERAKEFAMHNDTTLTALIEAYLRRIPFRSGVENAPIVRRLSGSLSPEVKLEDYHQHLDEKYGR